jgi:hypothetical protein
MKEKRKYFNIAFPCTVNSENQETEVIHTDPFGSYTGVPEEPSEEPVQDADDL